MQRESAKPVVLAVEDDDEIASLMQLVLEREGLAVERARDKKSGEALIAKMSAPMLATLDIQLPDGSGADLIPVIRARPGWERVPIVMVTAQARHEDVSGALKSGASAYLVKPFKPEVLRDTVRLILKRGGPFKP